MSAGDWLRERHLLEGELAADPHNVQLRTRLVHLLVRLGDPEAADAAAGPLPESDDATWVRAEVQLAKGEPSQARAALQALVHDTSPAIHRVALADACIATGDPATALGQAGRARLEAGSDVETAAWASVALATAADALGRSRPAEEAAVAAQDRFTSLSEDHLGIAVCLDLRGRIARHRMAPHDAVKLHNKALQRWEKHLGEDAPNTGACHHARAQALHRTGDFTGARVAMTEALRITEGSLGADHVDSWISRFELGRMALDCGDVAEGLQAMHKAAGVVRLRLGKDHPVVQSMERYL